MDKGSKHVLDSSYDEAGRRTNPQFPSSKPPNTDGDSHTGRTPFSSMYLNHRPSIMDHSTGYAFVPPNLSALVYTRQAIDMHRDKTPHARLTFSRIRTPLLVRWIVVNRDTDVMFASLYHKSCPIRWIAVNQDTDVIFASLYHKSCPDDGSWQYAGA